MKTAVLSLFALSFVLLSAGASTTPLDAKRQEEEHKDRLVECTMTFDLKSGSGEGSITCDNGRTAKVAIQAKGAFGKLTITPAN